jgi:2-methylcitrate dehydratase PrpD
MPAHQLAHALAICGTTAPGQWATSYTRHMGNHVKEGIPMATASAILALDLAAEGFTGPVDIYDAEDRYERARLLEGLGESWLIESVYFKPYSACRWAHAPVDALLALMSENALIAEDIEVINVATFNRALTLNNAAAPASLEAAQYSVPFCLGLAGTGGVEALLPMRQASLGRADAQRLATKVKLSVDPKLDAMFSDAVPARVTVGARGTQFSKTVLAPKGEPSVPMTDGDLEAKALTLCDHAGNPGLGQQLIEAAKQFRNGDRDGLMKLLSSPSLELREIALAAAQ